jgi:hypothetical protein
MKPAKYTSWRELLRHEMDERGDDDTSLICDATAEELDKRFPASPRSISEYQQIQDALVHFYAWTDDRVYFTVHDDDRLVYCVESVRRHPPEGTPQ